jgi:hypothetical protein
VTGLLGVLGRIFVDTVLMFDARRAGLPGAKTGAVTVIQRTSSDLRVHPHLHVLFLDGAYMSTRPSSSGTLSGL